MLNSIVFFDVKPIVFSNSKSSVRPKLSLTLALIKIEVTYKAENPLGKLYFTVYLPSN
ncbi:hypothetical protein [Acidianus brierleyi]|uniref:hypothetical protein n=1 Tax=Acidianus brierleyi TaxID=41673 RepID=UPI0013A548F0|nr:hypothetical protein [Acidianus brierleyi]